MITDKIQNLFNFIDFLHSNIKNFKQYDNVIKEFNALDTQRNNLKPRNNFKDKLKYDEVQKELEQKYNVIDKNIIQLLKLKAIEYNLCDWSKTETIWNYNISEITNLKENFKSQDVEIILVQKQKYIEFREKTNCNYFQSFFFSDLDKVLKELFDYFKESDKNEFDAFEVKKIKVNNINDAIQLLKKGNKSFDIELNRNNLNTKETKEPQQIETNKPDEVKKELKKNKYIKIFKNDLGYNIFNKMFECYKDENKDNANFGFLFYAMEKEFLVCSQTEFIDFVGNEEYEISISKIDSRQSGTNKKSNLYDAIKKSFQ